MRAKDLINYTIPPLKPADHIDKAKSWIAEFHIHDLAVVDDEMFLGFFNEALLFDHFTGAEFVEDFELINSDLIVNQKEHYYEVLKKAYDAGSNLVAVSDDHGKYIGVVTVQDVVEAFSKMSSIQSPGTIIVLSMAKHDYSMGKIGQIVEQEEGKILSSFIEIDNEEPTKLRLTIKLNVENGTGIISSLERHGYLVSAIFGQGEEEELEKERLDTLMRYLKI